MDFVVLPDHPAGDEIAGQLAAVGPARILRHHSGRPWIVGRWSDADITVVELGANRVAVLGSSGVTAGRLAELLRATRTVHDLSALVRRLSGCFHLVASLDGSIRAQGSLSSAREIYFGTVAGVTVAADRPQSLARLTGAGIHEELLALQLLSPFGAPWPLSARCIWQGVASLDAGHFLRVGADGVGRTERWWTPPEPRLPLAEGAALVREALISAVDARTVRGDTPSADLSGGMDSTTLCYLAARNGRPLTTIHCETVDPANHDPVWAARCRPGLPTARHLVIPPGVVPGPYSELAAMAPDRDVEAPLSLIRRAAVEFLAATVAQAGSRRHLTGLGSDELFRPSHMCLHAVARQHPLRAVRHIRAKKSMRRWNWATTVRGMSAARSYPRWLADQADRLTVERTWDDAGVDWEVAPRMPLWATPDVVDAARRLLLDAAAQGPEPLDPVPAQHEMIRLTRINGTMVRRMSRVGEAHDVSFEAPFVDDRVLEAALSIRFANRMAYGWAKPVLSAAMRDIAPADLLARRDKGDQSPELFVTLRRHRRELQEFCDDAQVVRLGLVDPEVLRTVVLGLHSDARYVLPFDMTLQCELWLRSLPTRLDPVRGVTQGAPG